MSKFWNFDRSKFDSLFSSKKPSLLLRSNKVCGMPSLLLKINFSCQFVTKQAKLVDLEWHNFRAIFTLWNILTILEYMWGLWRILLKMAPTHPDPVLVQAPSGSCFQFSIDVETTVYYRGSSIIGTSITGISQYWDWKKCAISSIIGNSSE